MQIINPNLKFTNLTPLNKSKIDSIALHHIDHSTATIQDVHSWHLNQGWAGCGYGWFVDKQGKVFLGRGFNQNAGVLNHNGHILSIAFQGNFSKETMSKEQIKSGIELIKYIKSTIPTIKYVYGHNHWNSTDCPGKNFPIDDFINPEVEEKEEDTDMFNDNNLISDWAKSAVDKMETLGIFKGDEQGNINPQENITKEELGVVIDRVLKLLGK